MLGSLLTQNHKFYDNEFSLTNLGKPTVPGIEFSISYRNRVGAIFISKTSCGIDIEENRQLDYAGIAKSFFSPRERAVLEHSSSPNYDFYKIWTQKESIVKATGQGLQKMSDICIFEENYNLNTRFRDISYKANTLMQNSQFTISYCELTNII
jgi:4'-phosphopantetheinyl transferase